MSQQRTTCETMSPGHWPLPILRNSSWRTTERVTIEQASKRQAEISCHQPRGPAHGAAPPPLPPLLLSMARFGVAS